jgi:hypothetical protein
MLSPHGPTDRTVPHGERLDPNRQDYFDALLKAWLPLTYAANSLNHSMGQPDLYPFVLAPAVVAKLRFVHRRPASSRAMQMAPK